MVIDYKVVRSEGTYRHQVGLCRFFADVREIESEEEGKEFLEEMKKKYPNANHHCWAWRLGVGKDKIFRYSDDGEPSQTAGMPILTAIDHRELTNTMIVVSRIYGGVNQGVGGLIRAYHGAASGVLNEVGSKTVTVYEDIEIPCRYDQLGFVLRELEKIKGKVKDMVYDVDVVVKARIRPVDFDNFKENLYENSNGTIVVAWETAQ